MYRMQAISNCSLLACLSHSVQNAVSQYSDNEWKPASGSNTCLYCAVNLLQASVASLPFIGTITVALQFLFVQRRGSADKNNRHTQEAGHTVEKLTERAADPRC